MRFWHILYSHVNILQMKTIKRTSTVHDQKYRKLVGLLVATRKSIGLTQAELAEKLGITQPDISKIERFERKIDALELIEWFQAFSHDKHIKADKIWKKIYENYCE